MSIQSRRQVTVILGMHRSGTSLLGGILHALGVDFGRRLIEGDSNNAGGYYEHATIVRLHRDLLHALDRRWTGRKGALPLPADWQDRPETNAIRAQLREVIAEELEHSTGLWGFKDPRASRFVPMWNEILREMGVRPLYVLAVRHQLAVAASIEKRDGLSPARAQLLWLQHTLEAIRDSGDQLCCVVEYDGWFTRPVKQAEALTRSLGLTAEKDELRERLAQHIRPELRHHAGDDTATMPLAADLYHCLATASASGRLPDEFIRIEAEVRQAQALLHGWAEVIEALPDERALNRMATTEGAAPSLRQALSMVAAWTRLRLRRVSGRAG